VSASSQRSTGGRTAVTRSMIDELRVILDARGLQPAQQLVVEFVARHGLTHRDIDALLVALAEDHAGDVRAADDDRPTIGRPPVEVSDVPLVPVTAVETPTSLSTAMDADRTDASEDDTAWMFGEEPESPITRTADDLVGQTFDDLLGDWLRTGGQLDRADVALLATRRGLSAAQHGDLLTLLENAGVDLPEPSDVRPKRAASKGYELHGDAVSQYLRTIGSYPLINASREVELWSLISQGAAAQLELDADHGALARSVRRGLRNRVEDGRLAHTELVCANLRLVVSIARAGHYEFSGVEFADRIQDGNLGLMRAADKFDGSKGFKFSTYATWWIRQSIERGIGNRGRAIRIPVHAHEHVQSVRKHVAKLAARLGREPTLAEVADMMCMDPGLVQGALDLMRPIRSLDELLGDEGDLRLSDVVAHEEDRDGRTDPAQVVVHAMFHADVIRVLRTLLSERAACIVERRFGIGTGDEETLEDISVDYAVTRERIRQIQHKAMTTLQKSEQVAALRSYLVDDSKAGWPGGSLERKAS
jgi:RNA polymerase primary sigma factor